MLVCVYVCVCVCGGGVVVYSVYINISLQLVSNEAHWLPLCTLLEKSGCIISGRPDCHHSRLAVNLVSTIFFYFPLFKLEAFQGKVYHLETDFLFILTSPSADKLKKQKPVKESSPLPYKIIISLHKIKFFNHGSVLPCFHLKQII